MKWHLVTNFFDRRWIVVIFPCIVSAFETLASTANATSRNLNFLEQYLLENSLLPQQCTGTMAENEWKDYERKPIDVDTLKRMVAVQTRNKPKSRRALSKIASKASTVMQDYKKGDNQPLVNMIQQYTNLPSPLVNKIVAEYHEQIKIVGLFGFGLVELIIQQCC